VAFYLHKKRDFFKRIEDHTKGKTAEEQRKMQDLYKKALGINNMHTAYRRMKRSKRGEENKVKKEGGLREKFLN